MLLVFSTPSDYGMFCFVYVLPCWQRVHMRARVLPVTREEGVCVGGG